MVKIKFSLVHHICKNKLIEKRERKREREREREREKEREREGGREGGGIKERKTQRIENKLVKIK